MIFLDFVELGQLSGSKFGNFASLKCSTAVRKWKLLHYLIMDGFRQQRGVRTDLCPKFFYDKDA